MMTVTVIGAGASPNQDPARMGDMPLASGFIWVDLDMPTDEEVEAASRRLGLPVGLSASLDRRSRPTPRCSVVEGWVWLESAAYRRRGAVTGDDLVELTFLIGPGALLTLHRGPIPALDAITGRVPSEEGNAPARPLRTALRVLDAVADGLIDASQSLEEQAGQLEDAVLSKASRKLPQRLIIVHRAGIKLRRLVVLESAALERLAHLPGYPLKTEEEERLADVLHRMSHAEALSDSVVLVNESALSAHLNVLNNRMNDVMKVLAAVGTIFLPLTFLTGLYGTNFAELPGSQRPYGFWVLVGVAAGLIFVMGGLFYRLGWFGREE